MNPYRYLKVLIGCLGDVVCLCEGDEIERAVHEEESEMKRTMAELGLKDDLPLTFAGGKKWKEPIRLVVALFASTF